MLDVGEVHGRGPSWAPSRPLIIFFANPNANGKGADATKWIATFVQPQHTYVKGGKTRGTSSRHASPAVRVVGRRRLGGSLAWCR